MLFGHHHTDTFHIVKDANGTAVQTMLLAPAVTPWFSSLPGAGANNPAFRFITFNDSNWDMLDITTYYVDLAQLNHNASTQWKKEYSFSDSTGYNISLINAQSMAALLQRMKDNDTLFQLYIKYNSVMYDVKLVDGARKIAQLCSIEFIDLDQYYQCLKEGSVTPSPPPTSSPSAASPLASQFSAYVSIILSAAIVLVLFS
uniref:Sphingomyelin phosphodiesterase C-terminal domain-containing protein n=1 Tax=Plectus sambesii TaxID=2011161 RepID=A0A914WDY4_9BILA